MSHFGDYMDGVSVKISEKYKRPPRIELPYSVNECPARAKNVVEGSEYCCQFESNVLEKVRELRAAKETRRSERRHRLQLLQEAKQKKLDAIAAAEAAERLKQLSVSEVSYPSTEEISEISPDDKADNCDTLTQETEKQDTADTIYPSCSTSKDIEPNILQPIQVQSNYQPNNLLDDPDPLREYKMPVKQVKVPQYNAYKQNIDTMTFKDFENDTSSPFDNVELKTINDMELLAQVLQSQREPSTTNVQPQYAAEQSYVPNCASQAQIEGMTYIPNTYLDQQVAGVMYAANYPVSNGYYIPENTCDNTYMPNYQYYVPNQYQEPYYQIAQPTSDVNVANESMFIPQQYYYYNPAPQPAYQYQNQYVPQQAEAHPTASQNTIKSRSRSVPDIVRELDEEITRAKLRATERSCNASPLPKEVKPSTSNITKKVKPSRKEQLPNPYEKLSGKLQDMCQRISGMGFPIDRVARVCTLVGDNDKKIIEGLLIMGELMDLGFPEGRVSAALAKHEFNRDKALDELVT